MDQFTHNNALDAAGFHANKDYFFTILNFTTNKIVMIPTSLAAGFAVSLIPFITKTFAEGRLNEMHRQIKTSIGVLMYITVPASLGIWHCLHHYIQYFTSTIQMVIKYYFIMRLLQY